MWKGRDAFSLVSNQLYSILGWRAHNTPKSCVCVCACPATLRPCGLDGTCAAAGGSPFQACYLLLNKAAAGNRTQSLDGQRGRERVEAGAYSCPRWQQSSVEPRRRGGDAVGLFKTPCLCEDHLSLRPVTMATGPAQCRGEQGGRGTDTMATQAVTATALMKAEGRALSSSLSFKETGAPS